MQTQELTTTLRETIDRNEMLSPGQTVVVGVSGGPDSTALLHALASLREEGKFRLVAAHLNHGFRGEEADGDAAFVEALAAKLDVPCIIERVDVPAMKRRRHLSAQEAAREVRHGFLRRVAEEHGAERIALGHTQDDRVETILLNLVRGTGPEGLRGFPPVALPIIRPLYDVSRAAVEAYCATHQLQPRHDSSNTKTHYRRNRIRAELLPHLATYYNAGIGQALLRMSELVFADNMLLEQIAETALEPLLLAQTPADVTLDSVRLRELPLALQRRVLRQAISMVRGSLQHIGFEIVEESLRALYGEQNFTITLPQTSAEEIILSVNAQTVRISAVTPAQSVLPWQAELAVPGETVLNGGEKFLAQRFANGTEATAWLHTRFTPEEQQEAFYQVQLLAFAGENGTSPLVIRSWRPGDRMAPRGLNGSKKLQDLFTDAKISAGQRGQFPVLVEAGGAGTILAVVGLRAGKSALTAEALAAHVGPVMVLEWQANRAFPPT